MTGKHLLVLYPEYEWPSSPPDSAPLRWLRGDSVGMEHWAGSSGATVDTPLTHLDLGLKACPKGPIS